MKTYVDIIRELREDRDLTQKEVAQYLGTTQQVYSRYENGENELPVRHLAGAVLSVRCASGPRRILFQNAARPASI